MGRVAERPLVGPLVGAELVSIGWGLPLLARIDVGAALDGGSSHASATLVRARGGLGIAGARGNFSAGGRAFASIGYLSASGHDVAEARQDGTTLVSFGIEPFARACRNALCVAGWLGAVVLHGSWNLACLRFDPSTQLAPVVILAVADALFFVSALVVALASERRMLVSYLSNEVGTGFIDPGELMAFRTLFGRERYVLAGRAHGTSALRRELRRAQLDLAFRKWHLKHGDAARGDDVDRVLQDCRIRIRDARNAINAAEGVVERLSRSTGAQPAHVARSSRSAGGRPRA